MSYGELEASLVRENRELREQNRVLTRYLEQARDSAKQVHDMAMKNVCPHPDTITMENVAIDHLEFLDRLLRAALTATSQPVRQKRSYSHHPAFDEYGEHR